MFAVDEPCFSYLQEKYPFFRAYLVWHSDDVDRQVLRENWSGQGDVIDVIDNLHERVIANAVRLYSKNIWRTLRRKLGRISQFFPRRRARNL